MASSLPTAVSPGNDDDGDDHDHYDDDHDYEDDVDHHDKAGVLLSNCCLSSKMVSYIKKSEWNFNGFQLTFFFKVTFKTLPLKDGALCDVYKF